MLIWDGKEGCGVFPRNKRVIHWKVMTWKTVCSILQLFYIGNSNKRWRKLHHLFDAFYVPGTHKICISSVHLYKPSYEGGPTICTLWISITKIKEVHNLPQATSLRRIEKRKRDEHALTQNSFFFFFTIRNR